MNPLLKRVQELLDRHGETFIVNSSQRKGIFSNISYGQLRNYIPDAEITLLTPPYWIVFVAGSDATGLNDNLTWNGATYPVRGLLTARWRSSVVAKLLVLGTPGTMGE